MKCVRAIVSAALLAVAAAGAAATPPCTGAEAAALSRDGFAQVVQRNAPAVVQVVVLRAGRDPAEEAQGFEFFQPMQGPPLPGGEAVERTFSSGFFIRPDGRLLASAHAVFDAREIWVVTADGKRLRASVLAMDRQHDVALLKVQLAGAPVVQFPAGAPAICPGGWVIAIGTPFGFDRTVTAGVVSAYPRYLHGSSIGLIQSDVVLNPGSSGGPLFDAEGALLGMSTMIFSDTGIYVGISFALPVDELMRIADALGRGAATRGGEIGAHTQPLTPDLARAFGLDDVAGALVVRVDAQGPAAKAGLRAGDVILGFTRGERLSQSALEMRLASSAPGTRLEAQVWRDAAMRRIVIDVGAADPGASGPPVLRDRSEESRLGLSLTVLKQQAGMPAGLYVEGATGSALLAGVERGDRIIGVNAIPVGTVGEFDAALAHSSGASVVALLVGRGGTVVYVPVSREGLTLP